MSKILMRYLVGLALIALVSSACGGARATDWKFGEALAVRVPVTAESEEVAYVYPDVITGEILASGNTSQTTFGPTAMVPIDSGSEIVKVDGSIQGNATDYSIDYATGMVTFFSPQADGAVTIDYTVEKHYVVRPAQDGHSLFLAHIIVVNSRSNYESLLVRGSSVQLLGHDNLEWEAVDPYGENRHEVEPFPQDKIKYVPFIWGGFDLPQSFQIEGWLIFEVPDGTKPRGLRWDTGDSLLLRF